MEKQISPLKDRLIRLVSARLYNDGATNAIWESVEENYRKQACHHLAQEMPEIDWVQERINGDSLCVGEKLTSLDLDDDEHRKLKDLVMWYCDSLRHGVEYQTGDPTGHYDGKSLKFFEGILAKL